MQNILDLLVDLSIKTQLNTDANNFLGLSYAKEFCTVKAYGPRQTGHTTAIRFIAKKYFNNPIILVPSEQFSRLYEGFEFDVLHFTDIRSLALIRKRFDAVIIDNAFMMSKDAEKELYQITYPILSKLNKTYCYIFVQ